MVARGLRAWWRLIRFGFRLLYNELAVTYDLVSKVVSLGAWRCWQRTALNYLPPPDDLSRPVLEIAHGTGDLQLDLHQAGYACVGLDLSADMGHIAAQKLRKRRIALRLVRGYAQRLPFPDEAFPAVVCTFPTPFIVEPNTLHDIYRVMVPGGRLVVVLSGILTGGGPVKSFLEWLYRITGQRRNQPESILRPFQQAGFRAELVRGTCRQSLVLLVVAEK